MPPAPADFKDFKEGFGDVALTLTQPAAETAPAPTPIHAVHPVRAALFICANGSPVHLLKFAFPCSPAAALAKLGDCKM